MTIDDLGPGDDALRAGTRALDDGLARDIGNRGLIRRVAEVELRMRAPPDLADAEVPNTGPAQGQCLLDGADHDDFRRAACQRDGCSRERAEHIDDDDGTCGALSASEQAVDADLHGVAPKTVG